MGLSTSLLLIAVVAAVVPIALIGVRPVEHIRDLEKVVVAGSIIVVVGGIVANGFHDLDFFGLTHLLYLLAVVSLPMLLGAWYLFSRRYGPPRRIDTICGVAAVLIALCGLYATHVEPRWLRVDRAEVVADIAAPLRIGVIADLQTPAVGAHEQNAITTLLDQSPDMVVIPGDWFQGTIGDMERNRADFVALLTRLVEGTQLVAVTSGDSDHSIPLQPMVEEAGAFFIDDTVLAFEINGIGIRLAGVRVTADGPARNNALATLSEPTDALTILVSHRPDVVYELPDSANVDLVIAGHTHGGQISIPLFGPPVTFSDVPRDIAAGELGMVNGTRLYVSAGVGMERIQAPQVRFGVRPEVGIITISPG